MKRFNNIADKYFRQLLEAPIPASANTSINTEDLPQDGGPVVMQNPKDVAATDRSPAELKTWETEILSWAKSAIINVQQNPSSISADDIQALSIPTTIENKDQQLDIIKRLGENI